MNEYYVSLMKCAERYSEMALKACPSLTPFIIEFKQGIEDQLPLMKLNRWLGFIQGTVIACELTSVEVERDWTRPLFRHLDFPE